MNALERRQRILELLSVHRSMKYSTLAERFNVSHRTIVNDISALSHTAPIYTETGPYGGVFLDPNWKVRHYLTTPEQEMLERFMHSDISPEDKQLLSHILSTFTLPRTSTS